VEEIEGKTGRDDLSARIKDAINVKLEELEGFGGVEGVFFTSFVLQ
jgi:flagellar FliL protein